MVRTPVLMLLVVACAIQPSAARADKCGTSPFDCSAPNTCYQTDLGGVCAPPGGTVCSGVVNGVCPQGTACEPTNEPPFHRCKPSAAAQGPVGGGRWYGFKPDCSYTTTEKDYMHFRTSELQ